MKKYYQLTPTIRRKMNSGSWLYVSENNQITVLSNEIVEGLRSIDSIEDKWLAVLEDSGIVEEKNNSELKVVKFIKEPKGKLFQLSCALIIFLGIVAVIFNVCLLIINGSPFVSAVNSLVANPVIFIIIASVVSLVTTMLHELMHIIVSKNKLRLKFALKKAQVTVPITHVWTWSLSGRIATIVSGMSLDSCLLLILLFNLEVNNNGLSIAASVLITRLLWQFILLKKNDIHLLINFIADNPFYMQDLKPPGLFFVKLFSILIVVIMVSLWMIPVINKLA